MRVVETKAGEPGHDRHVGQEGPQSADSQQRWSCRRTGDFLDVVGLRRYMHTRSVFNRTDSRRRAVVESGSSVVVVACPDDPAAGVPGSARRIHRPAGSASTRRVANSHLRGRPPPTLTGQP